jgi:hypothetical protein
MIYRELNGRKAVRCDICGAKNETVKECWWPYSNAAVERFDKWGGTTDGDKPNGQYYDACSECRQIADRMRQQFTDQRGVRVILRAARDKRRPSAA